MKASSNLIRRAGFGLLALATLAAAFGYTFVLNDSTKLPIKWPAGTIRLKIMLGTTANLSDGTSLNTSARTAAQTWNGILGSAQFQTELTTGTPGDNNDTNELALASSIFGKSFDGNTLAVTTGYSVSNERVEADIIFNTAYNWDSYRGNARYQGTTLTPDIQRVALHELGHVLGLDHPDEATPKQFVSAIMNSTIGNLDTLTSDDTEAAQSLYGPPGVPANDAFANATVINLNGSQSVTLKGYNTNATKETGDPRQGDNPGGRSVWWRWTAPSGGNVTLNTTGSYFDSTLGVYTGTALGNLTKIADNDDIEPGVRQNSQLTFAATAGTEYRIDVDGYNPVEDEPAYTGGADNAGITLNLTFSGSLGTAPAITSQPASITVTSGSSASFSVTASGTAPLTYQWRLNDAAISGATSATYNIASATSANAGNYTVVVSNAAGSVTSSAATLTVTTPTPPVVTPPSSGGGGGGGGAPSLWFVAALAALGLRRLRRS